MLCAVASGRLFPLTSHEDTFCETNSRHASSTLAVSTIISGPPDRLEWQSLPSTAKLYVIAVIVAGASATLALFPREWPPMQTLAALMIASCLLSLWKVNLPIPLSSGSTLSVSYAANLIALMLLGPGVAVLVAIAGVWTQCTVRVKFA